MGVIKDYSEKPAIGCIELSEKDMKNVTKVVCLADSKKALRDNQVFHFRSDVKRAGPILDNALFPASSAPDK